MTNRVVDGNLFFIEKIIMKRGVQFYEGNVLS